VFTNATFLELYARARRDEDLLPRRNPAPGRLRINLRGLLRRLAPRLVPPPAPVPIPVQPRQGTR
jgi:hypothetical protein